jgi:hypothetical protein
LERKKKKLGAQKAGEAGDQLLLLLLSFSFFFGDKRREGTGSCQMLARITSCFVLETKEEKEKEKKKRKSSK